MAHETILVETRGRVGLITLNRPKALNALNSTVLKEVMAALENFDSDPRIGAIVITGSEKAFAAGADIKEMADKTSVDAFMGDFAGGWHATANARKPVIAAVSGFALGGGCELVMQCDIIIAADSAKFGQPEIKLGVIAGIGGTQRLTRAIGKAKAMEMVLTGDWIDAQSAERLGLVNRVVPVEQIGRISRFSGAEHPHRLPGPAGDRLRREDDRRHGEVEPPAGGGRPRAGGDRHLARQLHGGRRRHPRWLAEGPRARQGVRRRALRRRCDHPAADRPVPPGNHGPDLVHRGRDAVGGRVDMVEGPAGQGGGT